MLEIIPSVNETEWVLVKKRIESVALAADWISATAHWDLWSPGMRQAIWQIYTLPGPFVLRRI